MKQLECLCFNCARVDGVSSGPCVFTSQLPILREKVPFVIIATRLGKILLCLACARCCGRRSVHTRVMVRHLGPSSAYPVSWLLPWLQSNKYHFPTANVCVEVLTILINLSSV